MYQNNGTARTVAVDWFDKQTASIALAYNVSKAATLVTDAHANYRTIGKQYNHIVVNHVNGEYSINGFQTNGIENYWSV